VTERRRNRFGLMEERRGVDWSNVIAALFPSVAMGAVFMYGGQRVLETAMANVRQEVIQLEAVVQQLNQSRHEEIQSVDAGSAARRSQVRAEMLELHNQQAREIDSVRADIREVRTDARGRR
jgi:iron-sulfur cluster repair protein YtfE (RIC family)